MRTGKPSLSVVIVSFNSARLIGGLLTALAEQLNELRAQIIVVDNASSDGSADLIADQYPWVNLIRSRQNLGFAAGNNLAVRQALAPVILFLNPDAIPIAGTILRGLEQFREDKRIGLAGARLLGEDGVTQPSARMFPNLLQEIFVLSGLAAKYPRSKWFGHLDRTWADADTPAHVDWVPGAFALMRTDLFKQLGGFDERYFLYYEEVDLCRRIAQAGYCVQYLPALKATHCGGASARTIEGEAVSQNGNQLTLWRARSGLLYYRKHHGWLTAWAVNRLERVWYALRSFKARLRGQLDKALEMGRHRDLLIRAWSETMGGRVAPPRPW